MPQCPTRQLILGTAGHIDHGKTALIRALTGIDTDRLPEEKQRGITIDIGFARLDLGSTRLGIVDVPGHERFIKNMLAGATGIDIALLVVAADDSVMPQTREHLEILRLLDVTTGVIAITKCDLANDDWLDLVEQDIRDLVRGTFLETASMVRTSATAGEGLDQLRTALSDACATVRDEPPGDLFRLAVDRAFNVKGSGAVVTGTVWSGSAAVGDELTWQPHGKGVRVRSLESHGHTIDHIERGMRAAIGLTGAHHGDLHRGNEIATPGYLRPTATLTVRLLALPSSPWPIKHRARIRLNIGTCEVIATLALLTVDKLQPGENADAQLHLAAPVTATNGQPFVVRSESPRVTIGGGHVLQPVARRIRRRQATSLDAFASTDPDTRAAAAVKRFSDGDFAAIDLARDANLTLAQAAETIGRFESSGMMVPIAISPTRTVHFHRDVLADIESRILRTVDDYHAAHPLHAGIVRPQLAQQTCADDAMIQRLIDGSRLDGDEHHVRRAGFEPQLSDAQRKLYERIVTAYRDGGFQPPDPPPHSADKPSVAKELLDLAVVNGDVAHLGGSLFMHAKHEHAMRECIAVTLRGSLTGLTVSDIRDLLGTSRKYAVPICEYFDRSGLTRRQGDQRVLVGK
jgi:selenocysteine-specific elongation factor